MWKTLIRPAMIFIPLGLGALCPMAHGLNFLIRWMLIAMLFMVFLRLRIDDLRPRRSHFRLLAANAAIGCVAYGVLWLCGADAVLARSAFFVGITPTATAAAVVMGFLRGRVGYVAGAFVITNVGIALLLPLLLPWVCGNVSWDFVGRVAGTLCLVMGLPLALAAVVRRIHPAASEWPRKMTTATFGLWSGMLFIIAADAAAFFRDNPGQSPLVVLKIGLISLALCALNFYLGHRLGEPGLRREASQSLGQKNTTLTIYLALVYAGPLAAMGPIFYVLWHNSYNALQMFAFDRKKAHRQARFTALRPPDR